MNWVASEGAACRDTPLPVSPPPPRPRHQGKYLQLLGPGSGSSAQGHCKTQSTFVRSCSRSGLPLISLLLLLPAPSEHPSPRRAPAITLAVGKTGGTGLEWGEKGTLPQTRVPASTSSARART